MTDGEPNNTYFVRSSDYIRLKNLEVGYNLSSKIVKRVGVQSLRFYASGLNLLTFTKMTDFDPESPYDETGYIWVNSEVYPLNKTINVGLGYIAMSICPLLYLGSSEYSKEVFASERILAKLTSVAINERLIKIIYQRFEKLHVLTAIR